MALEVLGTPRRTGDIDLLLRTEPPDAAEARFLGLLVEERSRELGAWNELADLDPR